MYTKVKNELFKAIDGPKLKNYCDEKGLVKVDICRKAGVSKSTIFDIIRRNESRIVNMNSICDVLEVPRDYFDKAEEPEVIPKIPEEEINISDLADMVDLLKDIVLSIKNQQAIEIKLLTEIGRTLAGFEGIVVKREEKEGWTVIKR